MFGKKKIISRIAELEYQVSKLNDKYWDISSKHFILLTSLGLIEVKTNAKIEYKKVEG